MRRSIRPRTARKMFRRLRRKRAFNRRNGIQL